MLPAYRFWRVDVEDIHIVVGSANVVDKDDDVKSLETRVDHIVQGLPVRAEVCLDGDSPYMVLVRWVVEWVEVQSVHGEWAGSKIIMVTVLLILITNWYSVGGKREEGRKRQREREERERERERKRDGEKKGERKRDGEKKGERKREKIREREGGGGLVEFAVSVDT